MNAFTYPRAKHNRRESPPQFSDYQRYRPYLQRDFARICAYCRHPDTLFGDFSIDHYRPKSIFPGLSSTYSNLYHCCSKCNRRKASYWPADPEKPYIPNPCDHIMTDHLRVVDGTVRARTKHGEYAIRRLNLNDPVLAKTRALMVSLIKRAQSDAKSIEVKLRTLRRHKNAGKVSQADFDTEQQALARELARCHEELAVMTGQVPVL